MYTIYWQKKIIHVIYDQKWQTMTPRDMIVYFMTQFFANDCKFFWTFSWLNQFLMVKIKSRPSFFVVVEHKISLVNTSYCGSKNFANIISGWQKILFKFIVLCVDLLSRHWYRLSLSINAYQFTTCCWKEHRCIIIGPNQYKFVIPLENNSHLAPFSLPN